MQRQSIDRNIIEHCFFFWFFYNLNDTNLSHWLLNRNGRRFYASPIADDVAYVFFSDGRLYRRDRLGTRRRLGLILLGRRTRRLPLPRYLKYNAMTVNESPH